MPLIAPAPRKIKWSNIRRGIKEILMAAAPNARVHSRWALKYDIQSTLEYLLAVNDPEVIHAWMVSVDTIEASNPNVGGQGGAEIQYLLQIRIWGFKGFRFGTDASNSQDEFENEVDDVVAYFNANRLYAFGLTEAEGRKYLRDINFLPQFEIEVAAFGEGYDVHVAKATMTLRIDR
jgi:hypothetical protein